MGLVPCNTQLSYANYLCINKSHKLSPFTTQMHAQILCKLSVMETFFLLMCCKKNFLTCYNNDH